VSLEKAIRYGKERRKSYTGAKAVSKVCRHGYCASCEDNKMHNTRKKIISTIEQIEQVDGNDENLSGMRGRVFIREETSILFPILP